MIEGHKTAPEQSRYNSFAHRAEEATKVPFGQRTEYEKKYGLYQYGQNFYMLFVERKRAANNPNMSREETIDLPHLNHAIDEFETQWIAFLNANPSLIAKIDRALDKLRTYTDLVDYAQDLLREGFEKNDMSKYENFMKFDIAGVGIYAWRPLNELLEQAAYEMEQVQIDPTLFFN